MGDCWCSGLCRLTWWLSTQTPILFLFWNSSSPGRYGLCFPDNWKIGLWAHAPPPALLKISRQIQLWLGEATCIWLFCSNTTSGWRENNLGLFNQLNSCLCPPWRNVSSCSSFTIHFNTTYSANYLVTLTVKSQLQTHNLHCDGAPMCGEPMLGRLQQAYWYPSYIQGLAGMPLRLYFTWARQTYRLVCSS